MIREVEYSGGPHDGRRVLLAGGLREILIAMPPRPAAVTATAEDGEMPEIRVGRYREQITREGIMLVWQGER